MIRNIAAALGRRFDQLGPAGAIVGVVFVMAGQALMNRYIANTHDALVVAGEKADQLERDLKKVAPYPAPEDLDPLGRVDDEDLADEVVDEAELAKGAGEEPW